MLASPIQKWLYGYDAETLSVAGPILALLGVAVIFNCMVTVTNGILQAHGKVNIPIYTTLVGGLVNIITDYVLIGHGRDSYLRRSHCHHRLLRSDYVPERHRYASHHGSAPEDSQAVCPSP